MAVNRVYLGSLAVQAASGRKSLTLFTLTVARFVGKRKNVRFLNRTRRCAFESSVFANQAKQSGMRLRKDALQHVDYGFGLTGAAPAGFCPPPALGTWNPRIGPPPA